VSYRIEAVVFDVGYTLIDETRRWREWAEWLAVEPEELWASMRSVIAAGRHHVEALKRLQPGFDLEQARADRRQAGRRDEFLAVDVYPDVPPCMARLKAAGLKIGAAGNMSVDVERFLAASGLGFDMIGSSQRWGVEKPNRVFFERVIEAIALPAGQIAYVGDRLDNDVGPSAAAGMCAIYLRRGLWAEVLSDRPEAASAYAVIDSLDELPEALPGFGRKPGSSKEH
jgi:HAD superfamily hydrolase (TIGR01549 family)